MASVTAVNHNTQVLPSKYPSSLPAKYSGITFAGMDYGKRLKTARNARGLTQNELAEQSHVGQGTISKIERGDQDSSSHDIALAYALRISPFWLSMGVGEMELFTIAPNPRQREILTAVADFDEVEFDELVDQIQVIYKRRRRRRPDNPDDRAVKAKEGRVG